MCAAVDPDPAVSLSTHNLLPMVSFIDHVDHAGPSASKVVDDGKAPDGNEPEMGRRGSRVADERCTRVNWFWCGVVRQSVEKNMRCGGMAWPMVE